MRSFPSALNRGGNNAFVTKEGAQQPVSTTSLGFNTSRMKAFNININKTTKNELLRPENINITTFERFQPSVSLGDPHSTMDAQQIHDYYDYRNAEFMNSEYVFLSEGQEKITNAEMLNSLDKDINTHQNAINQLQEKNVWEDKKYENMSWLQKAAAEYNRLEAIKNNETQIEYLNDIRKDILDENALRLYSQQEIEEIKKNNPNATASDIVEQLRSQNKNYKGKKSYYENPFKLPSGIISSMNRYKHVYKIPTASLFDAGYPEGAAATAENIELQMAETLSVPSMFNPICNIQAVGMIDNVPLLNDVDDSGLISASLQGGPTVSAYPGAKVSDRDITNCTIKELVSLSHEPNSILGMARYKYADFMYCKDVGKVSNNHLITLRKFSHPVGDNIFKTAGLAFANTHEAGLFDYTSEGDTGRLISWFDTDDNKLEDILNYKYSASWKELNAKIQPIDSQEDNETTGPLGMLLNSINPAYNKAALGGYGGTHNIFSHYGSKLFGINQAGNYQNKHMQQMYDNNKVYTPKNTIQDTHTYEGKLKFDHDINLKFSYMLRAYDNINPKTAFLDLLGNILEVTYRRGKFWGGSRRFIGSPANRAGWNKANKFIDEQWSKLGGFLSALASGTIDFQSIVQSAAAAVDGLKDMAMGIVNNIADGAKNGTLFQSLFTKLKDLDKKTGFTHGLKAQLKNAIGRPAMYAMDSLLSADNVGLWHLTIGNPKNPIMVMGNLILTNASIQHKGPLGVDDFPTELVVSVSLKPARSRDLTEIGHMYTKGAGALYQTVDREKVKDFFNEGTGVPGSVSKDDIENQIGNAKQSYQEKIDKEVATKLGKNGEKISIDELRNKIEAQKKKVADAEAAANKAKENALSSPPATTSGDDKNKNATPADNSKSTTQSSTEPQKSKEEIALEKEKKTLADLQEKMNKWDTTMSEVENKYGGWMKDLTQDQTQEALKAMQNGMGVYSPYINTPWAIRYETHGQNHALGARLIIDEMA